jgi:hypothetical protein
MTKNRALTILGVLLALVVGWWCAWFVQSQRLSSPEHETTDIHTPAPLPLETASKPSAVRNVNTAAPTPEPHQSIVDILARERAQAAAESVKEEVVDIARLEIPAVFRVLLKVPPAPEPVAVFKPLPTLSPGILKSAPSEPVAQLEHPPLFSIDQLLSDDSLLADASIVYNKVARTWRARWDKPRMFHFGMILKPQLSKRVQNGLEYSFSVKGESSLLAKDSHGDLVLRSGGKTVPLAARDVLRLLQSRIDTQGLTLYVDASGNLIMEAQGANADTLAARMQRKT